MFSITPDQAQRAIDICRNHDNRTARKVHLLLLLAQFLRDQALEPIAVQPSCETDSYIPIIIPFDAHFTAVLIKITPKAYDIDTEQSIFACNFRFTSCCCVPDRRIICEAVQHVYDAFYKPFTDLAHEFKEKYYLEIYLETLWGAADKAIDGAPMMGSQRAKARIVSRRPRKR